MNLKVHRRPRISYYHGELGRLGRWEAEFSALQVTITPRAGIGFVPMEVEHA
jgi:hypothetical protein